MSESNNAPPEPSERGPSETKAERPANDEVSAERDARASDPNVTDNNQKPTGQVDNRTENGGEKEPHAETESVWRQAKTKPLAFFTLVLAGATGLVAVATIALAVVTGFAMWATVGLRDATTDLVTATNRIADYAKEQGKDMKASLEIAQKSVDAAVKLAEETGKTGQIAQGQLETAKEGLDIQKLLSRGDLRKDRGRIIVPNIVVSNLPASAGLADIKPISGPPDAQIMIRNEGVTRAKGISGWASATIVLKGKNGNFAPVANNKIVFGFDNLEATGEKPGAVQLPSLTPIDIGKVIDGAALLFVYGQIKYTDVGQFGHYTRGFRFVSEQPVVISNGTLRLVRTSDDNEESE